MRPMIRRTTTCAATRPGRPAARIDSMTSIERVAAGPRVSRSRSIAIGRIWFAGLLIPFCLASVSYGQATYQVVKVRLMRRSSTARIPTRG